MREESQRQLIRRPTDVVRVIASPDESMARRVGVGAALVGVPTAGLFGYAEGIHLLYGVDPSLAHSVVQHLVFASDTGGVLLTPVALGAMLGVLDAIDGAGTNGRRLQPTIHSWSKRVRNGAGFTTIGLAAAAVVAEVAGLGGVAHVTSDLAMTGAAATGGAAAVAKAWRSGVLNRPGPPRSLGER